jgi:predicted N-acyltransferase
MEEIKFHNSISSITKDSWNKLVPEDDYPFLKYEFLELLEKTNCVGKDTGWHPAHILIERNSIPIGAMPLYIKTDSSGEFVFDYSWANAFLPKWIRLLSKVSFFNSLYSGIRSKNFM